MAETQAKGMRPLDGIKVIEARNDSFWVISGALMVAYPRRAAPIDA